METSDVYIFTISLYVVVAILVWFFNSNKKTSSFFSPWEYGECRGWQAKRNRYTGEVFFLVYDQYNNKHWYKFVSYAWIEFKIYQ